MLCQRGRTLVALLASNTQHFVLWGVAPLFGGKYLSPSVRISIPQYTPKIVTATRKTTGIGTIATLE